MKQSIFERLAVCLSLVAVSISMVAQDAHVNSQNPTPAYSASGNIVDNSDKVTVGYGGLDYYNFDNGFTSLNYWGFTLGAFSYTGGGFDMKFKTCFESEPGSGAGVDLLLN